MTIDFSQYNIGLKRGDVVLVPYSKKWAELFTIESDRLSLALKAYLPQLKFYHIGSTSIPGIVAKPILDILGEVDDVKQLDQFEQLFTSLGYEYKGEYGIPGRRYLTFYNEGKEIAFIHLHVFQKDSKEFETHLLFRDVLRKDEKLRNEYRDLKLSLIEKGMSRSDYSKVKSELILKVLNTSKKRTT